MKIERTHVLEKPFLVQPTEGSAVGVLPAGTRLYYERSFAEGYDLFRVFVRVEGAGLRLVPVERPGLIDPLGVDAVAPGRADESISFAFDTTLGLEESDNRCRLMNGYESWKKQI